MRQGDSHVELGLPTQDSGEKTRGPPGTLQHQPMGTTRVSRGMVWCLMGERGRERGREERGEGERESTHNRMAEVISEEMREEGIRLRW